jgi:hypothetical protein
VHNVRTGSSLRQLEDWRWHSPGLAAAVAAEFRILKPAACPCSFTKPLNYNRDQLWSCTHSDHLPLSSSLNAAPRSTDVTGFPATFNFLIRDVALHSLGSLTLRKKVL